MHPKSQNLENGAKLETGAASITPIMTGTDFLCC